MRCVGCCFNFSALAGAWKQHGSTQRACNLTRIHPCVQAVLVKHRTTVGQFSDFMASLDAIQANRACSVPIFFLCPQSFKQTSIFYYWNPLLDPCHHNCDRDQNISTTSEVFLGMRLLMWIGLGQT